MTNSIETGKRQIYRAVKKCLSFAIFYAFLARRSTARSSAVGINNGLFGVCDLGLFVTHERHTNTSHRRLDLITKGE